MDAIQLTLPDGSQKELPRGTTIREAIALILEHRREETLRGVPAGATREIVVVG